MKPQSNQRGIETGQFGELPGEVRDWPQSNQRGIETFEQLPGQLDGLLASIEPAWD